MTSERAAECLAFNMVTNCTPLQKMSLCRKLGSVSNILERRKEAEGILGKDFRINGKPVSSDSLEHRGMEELALCRERGIRVLTIDSDEYPPRLRTVEDPPLVLYVRGRAELLYAEYPVAVVGARKASNMSINMAYVIARDLGELGVTVVSGLAAGIDYYAHKGALDSGGNTVAVLGNGIDVVYPGSNADLYERVIREGALVSEFPLGTGPLKYNFPRRNRVISGLSLGTVVVEASSRSGALITASYAVDEGREVMALPGRAGSEPFAGNNSLIREGAHLVESACDVLRILGLECEGRAEDKKLPFSPLECNILRVIGDERVSIEDIERFLDDPLPKITSALALLELRGAVMQYPGKIFMRVYNNGNQ